jgi:hypothetical protein
MDEKKTYSIIGKVEIGTDEYRDLIEGLAAATKEADSQRSSRWATESKLSEANQALRDMTAKYNELYDFVKSDAEVAAKLKIYRLEKTMQEAE